MTRNDFSHNFDLGATRAYQTEEHSKKYPDSAFADPRWKRLLLRSPLIVRREQIERAIAVVHRISRYLEEERGSST